MSTSAAGKSRFFLLELILMIFIFSMGSMVCVQIFAKSLDYSKKSAQLTEAVNLAQSTAAILKGDSFTPDTLKERWAQGQSSPQSFVLHLDKDWKPCVESDAPYRLSAAFYSDNPAKVHISIETPQSQTPIYDVDILKYQEAYHEE